MPAKLRAPAAAFDNPVWTNRALARAWPALARRVPAACLPRLRRGRAPHGGALEAVEYGSGAYGTVLPTHRRGWVLKVTSDASEAAFAAAARGLRPYPRGLVRYGAVYRIPGARGGRPIYALWREEADGVGRALDPRDPAAARDAELLLAIRRASDPTFRLTMTPATRAANLPAIARARTRVRDGGWWNRLALWFAGDPGRAAECLERARALARQLARGGGPAAAVGAALLALYDRGIMPADVHLGNVGWVTRGGARPVLAITDPGHAIFLDPAEAPPAPPGVEDVDATAPRGRRRATAANPTTVATPLGPDAVSLGAYDDRAALAEMVRVGLAPPLPVVVAMAPWMGLDAIRFERFARRNAWIGGFGTGINFWRLVLPADGPLQMAARRWVKGRASAHEGEAGELVLVGQLPREHWLSAPPKAAPRTNPARGARPAPAPATVVQQVAHAGPGGLIVALADHPPALAHTGDEVAAGVVDVAARRRKKLTQWRTGWRAPGYVLRVRRAYGDQFGAGLEPAWFDASAAAGPWLYRPDVYRAGAGFGGQFDPAARRFTPDALRAIGLARYMEHAPLVDALVAALVSAGAL